MKARRQEGGSKGEGSEGEREEGKGGRGGEGRTEGRGEERRGEERRREGGENGRGAGAEGRLKGGLRGTARPAREEPSSHLGVLGSRPPFRQRIRLRRRGLRNDRSPPVALSEAAAAAAATEPIRHGRHVHGSRDGGGCNGKLRDAAHA